MKFSRFIILLCVVAISGTVGAQSQRELKQLMRDRGEYYFTLSVDDPTEIQAINEICSVDGTDGRTVVAYANQREYDKLLQAGYQPSLQTPPSMRANVTMWDGNGTYEWNAYLTYTQYVSMMESFPTKTVSGRSCSLIDLGALSTSNHRHLLGVRINNGNPDGKPKFLYTSTMHGDEVTGMILMLRLIDELCTSAESRIVDLVNNLDIYIFPLTNPDGTYKGGNNTVNSAQRYNGNNIDLNRNYKDYYRGDHPDGNSYEEETVWTMAFGDENLFTMSANYHGGAEVMNYPWDAIYDDHPDMDWYEHVCSEYVQKARQTYSSYMSDTYSDGVTNGAEWYVITGSRQDYMNAYAQCREVTVECSSTKTPSASQLPNFWNYNHNSLLAFMEQARNGVHGIVYDAVTNQPIEGVKVTVQNHDNEISYVTTHNVGDFHRPIKGGTYTFKFSKEGYHSETVSVTVADDQRQDIEVYLTPYGSGEAVPMDCYNPVTTVAAGSYVMGYLNGSTLMMPSHNNSSTLTSTSVSVTANDNGFSVVEETTLPKVTLTAYGNNGQYYISYNGRYLARSSSGSSLTWGTSTSSNGRWYINSNGIYVTSSSWSSTTTYYLYFDSSSNSFKLSTSSQNNIVLYTEGDCPTQGEQQTITLNKGWSWMSTYLDVDLAQLEAALGTNGLTIVSQNGAVSYLPGVGWDGNISDLDLSKMYMVHTSAAIELVLNSAPVDPATTEITLAPGYNWIGYPVSQSLNINYALSGLNPTIGDVIKSESAMAMYTGTAWVGSLTFLEPGKGYIYRSNASQEKTFTFPVVSE